MSRMPMDDYRDFQWYQADQYMDHVEKGVIPSCSWTNLAIERFKNDVTRTDIDVSTYQVDKVFEFFSILNTETINKDIGQFSMLPWQSFLTMSLFGPYRAGTDSRKYTKALVFVPAKNGKTTLVTAYQAEFLLLDGHSFPQSVLIASSQDQSKRALEALQGMVMYTPELSEILKFNRKQVYIADGVSQGFCETVPSKEASLQGYKLTSCILDEIHTYKDNKLYTAANKRMSSAKNPMLFMISTAGDDAKTFCKEQVDYGKKVLKGEVDDDSFFTMLFTLDNEDLKHWDKEENWYKVNPSLGKIKNIDFMRDDIKKAKEIPAERYDFLTYDLNVFSDVTTKWINEEYLLPVLKKIKEEDIKDRECYIGADFSEVKDLTSIALLFPDEEGETFQAKIYYILANDLNNLQRKGSINLKHWVKKKFIKKCQKSIIDDVEIVDLIQEADENYNVYGLGYDTRGSLKLVEKFKQIIDGNIILPIGQGWRLSSAIKDVQALIETKKIKIENNPVTKWNFDNVIIGHDDYGNWKLDKNKSLDSIDGVVALCNAYKVWEEINYDSRLIASEQQLNYWRNKGDI